MQCWTRAVMTGTHQRHLQTYECRSEVERDYGIVERFRKTGRRRYGEKWQRELEREGERGEFKEEIDKVRWVMRTDREIYPASFLEISICCLTVTRPNKNTAELRPEEENRLWEGKWSSSVGDRVQRTMLFLSGTGLRSDLWLQEHGHHSFGPENHILLWKHSKILLVYKSDLFINILNYLICRDMKNKDMPQSPWWNPNVNSTLKVFVIFHLPTTERGAVGHHVDPKRTIFSQDLQRSDQATGTNTEMRVGEYSSWKVSLGSEKKPKTFQPGTKPYETNLWRQIEFWACLKYKDNQEGSQSLYK